MVFVRYLVVSLCVVWALVSCIGSGQATKEALETKVAELESDLGTPEVEQTKTPESAEPAGLGGMLSPGETWQKGETEIVLSHITSEPGCDGLFGFQLEIADRLGDTLSGEDTAICGESDSRYSEVWWKSGSPTIRLGSQSRGTRAPGRARRRSMHPSDRRVHRG